MGADCAWDLAGSGGVVTQKRKLRWLSRAVSFLRNVTGKQKDELDITAEVSAHLDLLIEGSWLGISAHTGRPRGRHGTRAGVHALAESAVLWRQ